MVPEVFKVPRAAKILSGTGKHGKVTVNKVRMRMIAGDWPIGLVIPKKKTGNKENIYEIYRWKFEAFIGRKLTEEDFKDD